MTRRVLITRGAEDCRHLQDLVAACDVHIEPCPVLRFEGMELAGEWSRVIGKLAAARDRGRESWLLLASPRAPRPLCEQAPRHGGQSVLGVPVATVGRTTARAAEEAGLKVDLIGGGTGAVLADELCERLRQPVFFIFACAEEHRPELPETLRSAGHEVVLLPVYRMRRLSSGELPRIPDAVDAVVLTSPRSTRYYVENLGGRPLDCLHIALGPTTAEAAQEFGIQCRIPARPEMEALAEELCTI
jgi:uroporphyrinogen-III synthase